MKRTGLGLVMCSEPVLSTTDHELQSKPKYRSIFISLTLEIEG